MAPWKSGYVEASGIRLHYTRTGGDKPALVLAHGVTDDGLCWAPVAQALEADYDVIMLDARGHGRSDAPPRGYDPATQAADLAGAIAALGLRKPAVLGHSMGAATALVLAGAYPDAPGAILLEDPPPWWNIPPSVYADQPEPAEPPAWIVAAKRKTGPELIADQRVAEPGWSEAELGPWADSKLRFSLHVAGIFSPRNPASVDWPATLRAIACPALLITAEPARGAIVDEDDVAAIRTLVPHLQAAQVADAGHSIRRDQFDRYMEIVRAFLEESRRP